MKPCVLAVVDGRMLDALDGRVSGRLLAGLLSAGPRASGKTCLGSPSLRVKWGVLASPVCRPWCSGLCWELAVKKCTWAVCSCCHRFHAWECTQVTTFICNLEIKTCCTFPCFCRHALSKQNPHFPLTYSSQGGPSNALSSPSSSHYRQLSFSRSI